MNFWYHLYFYVFVFGFLVFGIYMLFRSITIIDAAKKNMRRLYSELHERNETRVTQIEAERRKYGTITKKANKKYSRFAMFLMRLDDLIIYSGYGIRYKWLNTSTYIVLSTTAGCLVFLVCMVLFHGVLGPLVLALLVVLLPYVHMSSEANRNYKRTEEQLEFFINMVSNNSMTTNDLVAILEKTAPYMAQPLRGALERAVSLSRINSNPYECIRVLTREIEHPIFKRFIRNLELCSRNDANYHNITKDFSKQLEISLRSVERMRAIYANNRAEILMLLLMGVGMLPLCCNMMETSFVKVIIGMTSSMGGMLILGLLTMIYGGTLLYLLIGMRR